MFSRVVFRNERPEPAALERATSSRTRVGRNVLCLALGAAGLLAACTNGADGSPAASAGAAGSAGQGEGGASGQSALTSGHKPVP
jgi:hypothetical protein